MVDQGAGGAGRSVAGRAWLHFLGLVVLAGLVEVVTLADAGMDASTLRAALPGYYYSMLPMVAAISVGMLSFQPALLRQALLLVLVTTLIMVGLDLIPATFSSPEAQQLAFTGTAFERRSLAAELHGGRVLRTLLGFVRGDLVLPTGQVRSYAPGNPRLLAVVAALNGGLLLLPLLLVGIAVGIQAWIAGHVTFRADVDERLAHVLLAWVFAPATFFLVTQWARRIVIHVLFGEGALVRILLPYVPVAIIAAVGWVTAWRASRWTAGKA